jgi:hypothetical protein
MVCLCLVVGVLVSAPMLAQTPDGETPAEETVCDPLKADGVTKGLYGLCVAFCEAQDIVGLSDPITEEELKALLDATPSGRILSNYNKKKQENDPNMPCVKVEEPCPCWSGAELAAIDGYFPDGTSTSKRGCSIINPIPVGDSRFIYEDYQRAGATFGYWKEYSCEYLNQQVKPLIHRNLSVLAGTLTVQEAALCLDAVNAACEKAGW